jgi:flagellar basal-body rod protein FlgC
MFNAINTAGTGLAAYRAWVDVLANNIANVDTVKPMDEDAFQAQYVEAQSIPGGPDGIGRGVRAVSLPTSSPEGIVTHDPESPLADDDGNVRRPDMDLTEQMGNLILAQRAFQANAATVDRAKETYESAIAIGKGL